MLIADFVVKSYVVFFSDFFLTIVLPSVRTRIAKKKEFSLYSNRVLRVK